MSIPFVDRASRLLFLLVSWWSVPSEDNDLVFLVNGDTPFSRVCLILLFRLTILCLLISPILDDFMFFRVPYLRIPVRDLDSIFVAN